MENHETLNIGSEYEILFKVNNRSYQFFGTLHSKSRHYLEFYLTPGTSLIQLSGMRIVDMANHDQLPKPIIIFKTQVDLYKRLTPDTDPEKLKTLREQLITIS